MSFWRAGHLLNIVEVHVAFVEVALLPLPNPSPHSERFALARQLLFVLLASGVAAMLVHHAASSARGVMASRPDLKLKEGLRKLKDYRAVHREFSEASNISCLPHRGCRPQLKIIFISNSLNHVEEQILYPVVLTRSCRQVGGIQQGPRLHCSRQALVFRFAPVAVRFCRGTCTRARPFVLSR